MSRHLIKVPFSIENGKMKSIHCNHTWIKLLQFDCFCLFVFNQMRIVGGGGDAAAIAATYEQLG